MSQTALGTGRVRSSDGGEDTKERLIRAGERLFARRGIDGARLRELNELAGQRNPSALHYHFGSRTGLVEAILTRHMDAIDVRLGQRLDELTTSDETAPIRSLVEAVVRPLADELETRSGRDFLRIVPQVLPALGRSVRSGREAPMSTESYRLLALLEARMERLPMPVRRERLVAYMLLLTSVLADRALQLESRRPLMLDREQFVGHVIDLVATTLETPSTVAVGGSADPTSHWPASGPGELKGP